MRSLTPAEVALIGLLCLAWPVHDVRAGSGAGAVVLDGQAGESAEPTRASAGGPPAEAVVREEFLYDGKGWPLCLLRRSQDGSVRTIRFSRCAAQGRALVCDYVDEARGASGRVTFPNYAPRKENEGSAYQLSPAEDDGFNYGEVRTGANPQGVVSREVKTKETYNQSSGIGSDATQSVGGVKK